MWIDGRGNGGTGGGERVAVGSNTAVQKALYVAKNADRSSSAFFKLRSAQRGMLVS